MTSTSSNILRDLAWPAGSPEIQERARTSSTKSTVAKIRQSITYCGALITRKWQRNVEESDARQSNEPRNRFIEAVKRIEFNHAYRPTIGPESPYGFFRNRPIIGEGVRINGGIFVGAFEHEAIVVDEKYGQLEKLALTLIGRCAQIDDKSSTYEYEVFAKAVALTRETLRYSEEGVFQIQQKYNIQPDDKVTLDLYLTKKVGVARHQVLLAAFLLERCRDKNLIRGLPSIDNQITNEIPQERLLFTSVDGEVFRFDPTRGFGKTAIH